MHAGGKKEEKLENKREEGKNKEGRWGIEPKIIGGTEKENPAHRGRKAGEFEGETEEKLKLNLDKKKTEPRRKNPEKQRKNQENASHTHSKNPDPNSKEEASTKKMQATHNPGFAFVPRTQPKWTKENKKYKQKREGPPESTNIVIGFPFYSASFHSQRKKLKRRGMGCWRKGT